MRLHPAANRCAPVGYARRHRVVMNARRVKALRPAHRNPRVRTEAASDHLTAQARVRLPTVLRPADPAPKPAPRLDRQRARPIGERHLR